MVVVVMGFASRGCFNFSRPMLIAWLLKLNTKYTKALTDQVQEQSVVAAASHVPSEAAIVVSHAGAVRDGRVAAPVSRGPGHARSAGRVRHTDGLLGETHGTTAVIATVTPTFTTAAAAAAAAVRSRGGRGGTRRRRPGKQFPDTTIDVVAVIIGSGFGVFGDHSFVVDVAATSLSLGFGINRPKASFAAMSGGRFSQAKMGE